MAGGGLCQALEAPDSLPRSLGSMAASSSKCHRAWEPFHLPMLNIVAHGLYGLVKVKNDDERCTYWSKPILILHRPEKS